MYAEAVPLTPILYLFAVFATVMVWMLKEVIYTAAKVKQLFSNSICSKYITVSKMECGQVISFQGTVSVYLMKISFSFLLGKQGK